VSAHFDGGSCLIKVIGDRVRDQWEEAAAPARWGAALNNGVSEDGMFDRVQPTQLIDGRGRVAPVRRGAAGNGQLVALQKSR
jgi:hypothetical protein